MTYSLLTRASKGSGLTHTEMDDNLTYFNNSKVVSVKDYGAVGDWVTDDYTYIQAAIDAVSTAGGGYVVGVYGDTYKCSVAPIVKTGVIFDLQKSTLSLVFASGADEYGVQVRDNAQLLNGTVTVAALGNPTSSDKALHCNVLVGQSGGNLASYKNWKIANLVLNNNRSTTNVGGTGVMIQAASNNGVIENIEFPSSTTLGSAVRIHWAGNDPLTASHHPHDISVRNIKCGTMTMTGTSFDVACVDLVGCYNVTVDNVCVDQWAGDAVLQVRAGGQGTTLASATVAPLIYKGLHVRNISVAQADQHGIVVNGKANDAAGTPVYSIPATIEGFNAIGVGTSATLPGVKLLNVYDTTIRNCNIKKFDTGFIAEEAAKRVKFQDCRSTENNEHGFAAVHATDPEDITFERCESWLNGQDGTSKAGFYAESCKRVHFIDCIAGDYTSETTQMYGFQISTDAVDTQFRGRNRVRNIKGGGTKFYFTVAVHGDRAFCGGSNAALSTTNTEFAPLSGVGLSSSETDSSVLVAASMVLTNFNVKLSAAPNGATKSRTLRIIDDGGATANEVAISDASTTGTDYDAVEVTAGSELSVQSLVTNTPDAGRAKWSCEAFLT